MMVVAALVPRYVPTPPRRPRPDEMFARRDINAERKDAPLARTVLVRISSARGVPGTLNSRGDRPCRHLINKVEESNDLRGAVAG